MRRLGLVHASDELTGKGPAAFERLARSSVPNSPDHIGLLSISLVLAKRATVACVVPSHNTELLEALTMLQQLLVHARKPSPEQSKRLVDARIRSFSAAPMIENATVAAVHKANEHLRRSETKTTELDPHADHVVDRYVRLSAHYACAAVCHTLDAWSDPVVALDVLSDSNTALCYLATGLGAGRHAALRAAAVDQARWESSRFSASGLNQATLAVQIFHEYLGGRFRAHMDVEQQRQFRFIHWALGERAEPTPRRPS